MVIHSFDCYNIYNCAFILHLVHMFWKWWYVLNLECMCFKVLISRCFSLFYSLFLNLMHWMKFYTICLGCLVFFKYLIFLRYSSWYIASHRVLMYGNSKAYIMQYEIVFQNWLSQIFILTYGYILICECIKCLCDISYDMFSFNSRLFLLLMISIYLSFVIC